MFLQFNRYFSPDDAPGGAPPPSGTADKEELIDFLKDEEDEEDKETIELVDKPKAKTTEETDDTEGEEDEKEDEEDDELKALEEEIEEPTDEQLELVTPARRRDILKKYPTLFKDFPYLEKAYYREQQFTELLPTLDDAKNAVEKSRTLDQFEQDLLGGNTEIILKTIKETDQDAFYKIVDNYMPTLSKVDPQAYLHVIGNVMKHTIASMVHEARASQNEALQSAAQILNQFAFGTSNYTAPTNLYQGAMNADPKLTEIQQREQAFRDQQFGSAYQQLNTRVENVLKNTIDANIDPKGSMSDYVKKHAVTEATGTLNQLIQNDARFRVLLDKLWEKAFESDFDKVSTDRIRSAIVSKARTLLPSVIKKARNEALRGMGKRVRDDEEQPSRKGPLPSGRPSSQSSKGGNIKKAADIPRGMTTLEFLNSE